MPIPLYPLIDGIESVNDWTYEDIWEMERLPHHLMILGAGPVGSEMAQAFRRLGAEVTLIEKMDRVLPVGDVDASRVLSQVFMDEGINLHCG